MFSLFFAYSYLSLRAVDLDFMLMSMCCDCHYYNPCQKFFFFHMKVLEIGMLMRICHHQSLKEYKIVEFFWIRFSCANFCLDSKGTYPQWIWHARMWRQCCWKVTWIYYHDFLVQCQYKSSAQILNLIYLFVYLSEHKYIPHNQEHKGSPLIGLSLWVVHEGCTNLVAPGVFNCRHNMHDKKWSFTSF